MTSLPSDFLTQVALHYGRFNSKIDIYNDVPIWFNATQIAYNLRHQVNHDAKFALLDTILKEVKRVAIEDASGNFKNAFCVETQMVFPNSSAKSVRKYLEKLGNDIPWDASHVRTFAVNTFSHYICNLDTGETDPSFQGGRMLYGDFIFTKTDLPEKVDRTRATVRVAKAYSVGDCVTRIKVFGSESATIIKYVAYCLIVCNDFAFRWEDTSEMEENLIAHEKNMNVSGPVQNLLFNIDTIFFVGNCIMEMLLDNLSDANVDSVADISLPIVCLKAWFDINSSRCPHKYYTFKAIERKVSQFSKKVGHKDASRKLMYTTFIPMDQVKDFQLTGKIKGTLRSTLWQFLAYSSFLFQGQDTKSNSLAVNKMDFRTFFRYVCDKMDHWNAIGELVEDFYMMTYREQKWCILKGHSEEFICSPFANCRSEFDHLVLQFLEKYSFSITAKKDGRMDLDACDHCQDEVRSGKRKG